VHDYFGPGTVVRHRKITKDVDGFLDALDDFDKFGSCAAGLGDLDGDGIDDLAVGAPGDDDGGTDRGAVYVLFLDIDGSVARHQKISDTRGRFTGTLDDLDNFGSSVTALGDLDGDGIEDLVVGAPFDDDGAPDDARGAVWVLFLRADGTVRAHQKISNTQGGFTGELDNSDWFGTSVVSVGDLDGDGIIDLAVGAWSDDDGALSSGAVWVLFLQGDGTVKAHQKISETLGGFTGGLDGGDGFGSSVATAGDLDGDGVRDLLVGASWDDSDADLECGALWLLQLDGIATIDFEAGDDRLRTDLVNGQDISSPPEFGRTLMLASTGANLGPGIFDSTPLGPNDQGQDHDLLVGLGNLLILQNSLVPAQTLPGIFDQPSPDPDGGNFTIRFAHRAVEPVSMVLVDIDPGAGQMASVTLLDSWGRVRVYDIPAGWTEDLVTHGPPGYRTLDLTTIVPQPGFQATATASESSGFDPQSVVRIEIELGSSGAVDNLRWDPHPDS
jgi:hypothetical protein